MREVRTHFTECHHDHVADNSDKAVAQEDTERTAANECSSRTNDKTRPDCTTELVFPSIGTTL